MPRRGLILLAVAPLMLRGAFAASPVPDVPPCPPVAQEEACSWPDPGLDQAVAPGENRVLDRIRWERDGHVGPDGLYPLGARLDGYREMLDQERLLALQGDGPRRPSARIPGSAWTPIGPRPTWHGGTTTYAGRITALAPHPSDGAVVYVGTANGGVWKTVDGGEHWVPLTDKQPSLAVGALALAPGNPETIWVGTGEPNFACDTHFGVGLLRSTDGGYRWTQFGAATFANLAISRVVIHPTNPSVMWVSATSAMAGFICGSVGSSSGVYKSTDGGVNWSTTGSPGGDVSDLVIDPFDPQVLFLTRNYSGVYRSTNGGTSWSPLTGTGLPASGARRIDLAIHPTVPGTVYALYTNGSGNLINTWKSIDSGASWTPLASLPSPLCAQQCFYDLLAEVAPDGALWEGGYGLFRTATDGAVASDWAWQGVNHPDQHALAFGPGGAIWVGHDGGVQRSTDGGASWTSRNGNLGAMQFYPGAALHPTDGSFALAGCQDNGSQKWTGSGTWTWLRGGDGAFSAIDPTSPDTTWYTSWQYLGIAKTTNGGTFASAVTGLTDSASGANSAFIAPLAICPGNSQVLIAASNNVWRTNNGAASWASNSPDPLSSGVSPENHVRALAFEPSDATCGTYFAAVKNGKVHRTMVGGGAGAGAWVDISTGLPGRGIADLAVDPSSPGTAWAAIAGYGAGQQVYRTTDALSASPTWAAASAGLPNSPTNAVLVDPVDGATVYAGNDLGVWRSTDSGASWAPFMTGHPVVPVHDLAANAATGALVSFTHGRGAFRLVPPAPRPVPDGAFVVGLPLRASEEAGGAVRVLFDTASCTPGGTNAFLAPLDAASLAAYAWSGEECGVVSGGLLAAAAGAADLFFVVAGHDGAGTGSGPTQDSSGAWQGSGVGRCGLVAQVTSATCP